VLPYNKNDNNPKIELIINNPTYIKFFESLFNEDQTYKFDNSEFFKWINDLFK